jgi:hypothetical protein
MAELRQSLLIWKDVQLSKTAQNNLATPKCILIFVDLWIWQSSRRNSIFNCLGAFMYAPL